MGFFRQIAEYLYIKKRDPNAPRDQWIKYMHGMNRLSIMIFLCALLIMLIKFGRYQSVYTSALHLALLIADLEVASRFVRA